MVTRDMPRVHQIVLPVLRAELPPEVSVGSWTADIDHRTFPIVKVRRLGGLPVNVSTLDRPVIELTAFTADGLVETENLLMDARQVIFDMVKYQTVTPAGYLHSYFETMGPTQFDSPFEDTWRIQALIQLGVRPPRN